jgi:hypothetical protein
MGLEGGIQEFLCFWSGGVLLPSQGEDFWLEGCLTGFAIKRVVALFRKQSIQYTFYIDDLLFLVETWEEALWGGV